MQPLAALPPLVGAGSHSGAARVHWLLSRVPIADVRFVADCTQRCAVGSKGMKHHELIVTCCTCVVLAAVHLNRQGAVQCADLEFLRPSLANGSSGGVSVNPETASVTD
jgi:hypothetical protein